MRFLLLSLFALSSVSGSPSRSNSSSSQDDLIQRDDDDYTIKCFSQNESPSNQLYNPLPPDCLDACLLIIGGDKPDAPMQFSRTTGFVVPYRWNHGTCAIIINIHDPDDDEVLPLSHIAYVASKVIEFCVENSSGAQLGGRVDLGAKLIMSLFVIGKQAPEHEWPIMDRRIRPRSSLP
ncbi:hypothetical protein MMC24_000369 [Lignoscripta atroalba]|nr:hypothetical protein [Lignoscripta atroalba]